MAERPQATEPDRPSPERPSRLRTTDTTYGKEYWDTLDGGAGYQDSVMWSDIAHIVHEVFAIDFGQGVDRAGEHRHVDVGCAFGYLVRHLRLRGIESWGLDISKYALGNAPADVADYLRRWDVAGPDESFFGLEAFTLVTCIETLEHVPAEGAQRAVSQLYGLLRPGGCLLATICVDGQEGWDSDPTHVNVRPVEYWRGLFREAGFRRDALKEQDLARYWLFSRHKGVIAAFRPV